MRRPRRMALDAGVDVELPAADAIQQPDRPGAPGHNRAGHDRPRGLTRFAREVSAGALRSPYVDPDYAEKITNSAEHQQLALKAAHEAIILAEEPEQPAAAGEGKVQAHCRDRAECCRTSSGRIQQQAGPGRERTRGDQGESRDRVPKSSTRKAARSPRAFPTGTPTKSCSAIRR